jgi:hypothetical protein
MAHDKVLLQLTELITRDSDAGKMAEAGVDSIDYSVLG